MKIRMTATYSEQGKAPQKGDVLDIFDTEYDEAGDVDFYICKWEDDLLDVYPYECEVIE